MTANFDRELEADPVEPLGGESTDAFFRRLVQGLFKDGEFVQGRKTTEASEHPQIWRDPMIFLRPRNAGLITTLDNIIEDMENANAVLPEGLAQIVGIQTSGESRVPDDRNGMARHQPGQSHRVPAPDILFSKPANQEQYRIAERLTESSAVLGRVNTS